MNKKISLFNAFFIIGLQYFGTHVFCQTSLTELPRLRAIDFVDSLNGWFVGEEGTVVHTLDGGQTWEILNIGRMDVSLYTVDFINVEEGWVGGAFTTSTVNGIIMHTQDGGQTWEVQHEEAGGDFRSVTFIDEKHGWAGGVSSSLFYTSDGGKTWSKSEPMFLGAFVLSISFIDSSNGWADGFGSGEGLPLLNTKDGGRTWEADSTMIAGLKVFFADSLHGWIMRGNGGVWRTADFGKSWDYFPVPQTLGWQFLDIFFVDSLVGYLTNEIGTYRSEDGGKSWQMVSEERADDIFFTGKNFGWGVNVANGDYKRLAYTSDGAKTWNSVVITAVEGSQKIEHNPSGLTLFPNYPNPFNPETKIRFELHRPSAHIKLVIFDIQGKEMITLIDEHLPAGHYEKRWNSKDAHGNTLPSGVYFYQIISKNAKQTKKMLLLR